MNLPIWQQTILVLSFIYGLIGSYQGYIKCKYYRAAFGLTPQYYLLGAFVWGDTIVFGIFWMLVSAFTFYVSDWLLFLLIIAIFWAIRGIGESIYWFNQQFSTIHRNPPEELPMYDVFGDDSIWFVYQIIAQCISIIAIVCSIYFGWAWIQTLPY